MSISNNCLKSNTYDFRLQGQNFLLATSIDSPLSILTATNYERWRSGQKPADYFMNQKPNSIPVSDSPPLYASQTFAFDFVLCA